MSEGYYGFERFCSILSDQNILKKMSATVVQGNLQKCVEEIKTSTLEELFYLDKDKIDIYIDLMINRVKQQDYIKGFGVERIQEWLVYFDVKLNDVLDFKASSSSFQDLVGGYYLNHPFETVPDDKIEDYKIAKNAQEDFLLYFLDHYANQLISFLESKKIDQQEKKDLKIENFVKNKTFKNHNKYIFKSKKAETWFNNVLEELGAIDEDKKKAKGLQAKADALFKNSKCKKNIFKYNLLLKKYISFLNKEYQAEIKSDSRLSDGSYHEDKIEELINSYLNK